MTSPAEWHLDTSHIGHRVLVFDQLESTNTHAASLAADTANNGLVILANEQTAGRGQHGRTWQCGAGTGVLLSVLLFPPEPLRRPAILTAWAAVSVCETIRQLTGLQAKIKWPNDVLIRGRKVCGILIEQRAVGSGQWAVGSQYRSTSALPTAHCPLPTVCGIGLNVNQTAEDFARAKLPEAGSLSVFSDTTPDCQETARALIAQLDEEYGRLIQGDCTTLEACWKWRIGLLGKPVLMECADGTYRGRLRDLGWDGVELELSTGDVLRILPERVQHLTPV